MVHFISRAAEGAATLGTVGYVVFELSRRSEGSTPEHDGKGSDGDSGSSGQGCRLLTHAWFPSPLRDLTDHRKCVQQAILPTCWFAFGSSLIYIYLLRSSLLADFLPPRTL